MSRRDPTKPLYFSVERDLSSLEFLKGVWAPKAILYFREKFPFAGYEVLSSAESFATLKYTW